MSAINHYLAKGYLPMNKTVTISGLGTVAIWTPSTSTRIAVTNVVLSNIYAGTIAFYWGGLDRNNGDKIAEFVLSGSSNITPAIGIWNGTAYDRVLYAKCGAASATDGVRVNLTGFEVPIW